MELQVTALRRMNAALLVLVVGLALLAALPRVSAQQAGGPQLFAITAPGQGAGNNVLFVIDPSTTRLLVYEHRAGGKLELVSVRNMEFELRYQEWSPKGVAGRVQEPSVESMRPR
jgi:hypothetical protein